MSQWLRKLLVQGNGGHRARDRHPHLLLSTRRIIPWVYFELVWRAEKCFKLPSYAGYIEWLFFERHLIAVDGQLLLTGLRIGVAEADVRVARVGIHLHV